MSSTSALNSSLAATGDLVRATRNLAADYAGSVEVNGDLKHELKRAVDEAYRVVDELTAEAARLEELAGRGVEMLGLVARDAEERPEPTGRLVFDDELELTTVA